MIHCWRIREEPIGSQNTPTERSIDIASNKRPWTAFTEWPVMSGRRRPSV